MDPPLFAGSTAHGLLGDLTVPLVSTRLVGLWPEGVAHVLEWPSPSLSLFVRAFIALNLFACVRKGAA